METSINEHFSYLVMGVPLDIYLSIYLFILGWLFQLKVDTSLNIV